MDDVLFWTIIGEAYRPDAIEEAEALRAALGTLKWFDLLDFQVKLEERAAAADTPELRSAAFLINGDASEIAFRNFRLGLVASGQRAYEAALKDPDSLADFLDGDPIDGYGMDRVALLVYEEKTGGSDFFEKLAERRPPQETPPRPVPYTPEPAARLRAILPKLSEMYLSETKEP